MTFDAHIARLQTVGTQNFVSLRFVIGYLKILINAANKP